MQRLRKTVTYFSPEGGSGFSSVNDLCPSGTVGDANDPTNPFAGMGSMRALFPNSPSPENSSAAHFVQNVFHSLAKAKEWLLSKGSFNAIWIVGHNSCPVEGDHTLRFDSLENL